MYNVKIVNCGNILEIYKYKTPIYRGYQNKIEKKEREKTEDVKKENLQRSIKRSKRRIFELVNTNYVSGKSSFLTITFRENLTDYDLAFNYWDRFKKKVEYHYKLKLEYCGVVEFQERGSIHFHICLFNIPFLEQNKLYKLWNSIVPGGVNIQGIKDNECDNVGAYMTYYMNKDLVNSFGKEEYKNRKRYFYSRNLKNPTTDYLNISKFDDKILYENLISALNDYVTYEYKSEYKKSKEIIIDSIDYETGEIKKELYEDIEYLQILEYKQITLNQNKNYRNFNKKNNQILL